MPSVRNSLLLSAPLLIALLALPAIAIAQVAPHARTGNYRIAGRIVDASTGEPVARATLAALSEGDNRTVASVQSDASGRFSLEHMSAGKYPFQASKRGYRTEFFDEHDGFNSAIVTGESQETEDLIFRLPPAAVLYGVITADGGDPVEGANVMLFRKRQGTSSGQRPDVAGSTTTDDTGAYEFGNLEAGAYQLAVSATPWYALRPPPTAEHRNAALPAPLDVAYPVTYFDSTIDEASAATIEIAGGSHIEADVNLHAVPALRLAVLVPRNKGETPFQAELRQSVFKSQAIQVSAENSPGPAGTQTVVFSGVAPGHYELMQGDPPRIVDLEVVENQEVDPGAGTPAMSVNGALRVAGGGSVPDQTSVTLEPLEAGLGRQTLQMMAHEGQFKFDAVAPGTWSVSAESAGQVLPVVSVAANGVTAAGSEFTVKDRPLSLVATVNRGGVRVQGFARQNSKGKPGVMVVLIPRQPSAYYALVRRDQSDSDGSFSLHDVPPGQYTVVAIEDGWKLEWQKREVMARYLPGGVAVTINEKSGAIVPLGDSVPVQQP